VEANGRSRGGAKTVDVILPTLDEEDRIGGTLESVFAGAGTARLDVIAVDGGSRDRTRERARAAGARVVRAEPGRARQLQAGLAATAGEVVVFLHADTRLPAGWADALSNALSARECVGGAFDFAFAAAPGAPRSLRWVEGGARLRSRWLRLPYGDQALFARRRVLREIGGVPQASWMEDLDLVWRLRSRGRITCLPLAIETSPRRHVEHGVGRTAVRHAIAACGWWLGLPREPLRRWITR